MSGFLQYMTLRLFIAGNWDPACWDWWQDYGGHWLQTTGHERMGFAWGIFGQENVYIHRLKTIDGAKSPWFYDVVNHHWTGSGSPPFIIGFLAFLSLVCRVWRCGLEVTNRLITNLPCCKDRHPGCFSHNSERFSRIITDLVDDVTALQDFPPTKGGALWSFGLFWQRTHIGGTYGTIGNPKMDGFPFIHFIVKNYVWSFSNTVLWCSLHFQKLPNMTMKE